MFTRTKGTARKVGAEEPHQGANHRTSKVACVALPCSGGKVWCSTTMQQKVKVCVCKLCVNENCRKGKVGQKVREGKGNQVVVYKKGK